MTTGMDIRNIKIGIATVCIIVIQAVTVVWIVASAASDIKYVAREMSAVKDELKTDKSERRLWEQKMETALADLRVRVAVLEDKVKDIEIKSFGR